MTKIIHPNLESDTRSQPVPAPWERPNIKGAVAAYQTEQMSISPEPLLAGAKGTGLLQLPNPTLTSIKLLLRDWLKLGAHKAGKLTASLDESLGLLFWLAKTV